MANVEIRSFGCLGYKRGFSSPCNAYHRDEYLPRHCQTLANSKTRSMGMSGEKCGGGTLKIGYTP